MLEWFWLLPVYPLILIRNDEGRGIRILPEIFYWCNSRFPTEHPSSLHLHILQNSSFSCQNVTMSMGICAMCNIMHCITCNFPPCLNFILSRSLAPFFPSSEVCRLAAGLQLWSCISVWHNKILGSKMLSELKRKCWLIKTEMEGASPFFRTSQVPLEYM